MKFIHLRHMTPRGTPATHGGVTVCYQEEPAGHISYAIARCNDNDNYCRAYGRAKAQGRLLSPRLRKMITTDNYSSPVQRVIMELVERGIWNGI